MTRPASITRSADARSDLVADIALARHQVTTSHAQVVRDTAAAFVFDDVALLALMSALVRSWHCTTRDAIDDLATVVDEVRQNMNDQSDGVASTSERNARRDLREGLRFLREALRDLRRAEAALADYDRVQTEVARVFPRQPKRRQSR
jgi:hypothetical protein